MPPPVKRRRKGAQMTIEDVLSRGKQLRTSSPASASSPAMRPTATSTPAASSPIHISDSDSDAPIRPIRAIKLKKAKVVESDDDSDSGVPIRAIKVKAKVVDSDDDSDSEVPILASKAKVVDSDSDDDSDNIRPAKRRRPIARDSGSETEDDVRPAKRSAKKVDSDSDSDGDGDSSSDSDAPIQTPKNKRSRLVRNTSSPVSSAIKRSGARPGPRSARSEKQRRLELLRRRRMGEKITESDLESGLSDVDEEAAPRALYDKDPDHVALSDFEDDEDEEEEEKEVEDEKTKKKRLKKEAKRKEKEKKKREKVAKKAKKAEKKAKAMGVFSDDEEEDDGYDYNGGQADSDSDDNKNVGSEDDMADFIDDTKLGVLGAPDGSDAEDEQAMLRREMPLQFTFQAHKPLQSHFKDAVEWLVHRRLHEGTSINFTEADDELYRVAWDRLDREVGGLAQSRFISSVWTPEFYSALRARPYMDSFNIRPSGGGSRSRALASMLLPGAEENICHACGRTNHPASFQVTFSGKPYYSKTLDDVEEDSDDSDDSDSDTETNKDKDSCIDMNGNPIAPTSRRWMVGVTCHSNAETAHDLLHWRRALKDWVEEKMQADHLLDDHKKKKKKEKSEKKMRKLREFGYKVADDWEANGTINSLFRDFKKMLEAAQVKSTQTRSRFGR